MLHMLVDLFDAVALSVLRRRLRALLTSSGTVLGVAAFVSAASLSATTEAEVNRHFDRLRATELRVTPASDRVDTRNWSSDAIQNRLGQIDGVETGGVIGWRSEGIRLRTPLTDQFDDQVPIVGLSAGSQSAVGLTYQSHHLPEQLRADSGERYALLGASLAHRIGLNHGCIPIEIELDGMPMSVRGVISESERRPDLMYSVVVPLELMEELWGSTTEREVLVVVRVGAADVVRAQLPIAVQPSDPHGTLVLSPVEPSEVAGTVGDDLERLTALLAILLTVVGSLSIAAATYGAVTERIPEFGLRRALGASATEIGTLVALEAAIIGAVGGIAGAVLGVAVTIAVAASQDWSPVLSWTATMLAPGVGLTVGLLAGAVPAVKASRIDPITALRT